MGKLGIPQLKQATDLLKMFQRNQASIYQLKQKTKQVHGKDFLHLLDDISNIASKTADISQAISDLFPSNTWKKYAQQVQQQMQQVYFSLNNQNLFYQKLRQVEKSQFSKPDTVFLYNFKRELQKQGVGIQNKPFLEAQKLRQIFVSNAQSSVQNLEIREKNYKMNKHQIKKLMTLSPDPQIRQLAYEKLMHLSPQNASVLHSLISYRNQGAKILGFRDFSQYSLHYQSFPIHPDSLLDLLMKCHDCLLPKLQNQKQILHDLKKLKEQQDRHNPIDFYPWDTAHYIMNFSQEFKLKTCPFFNKHYNDQQFFTIENIMQGLMLLCSRFFQIELQISGVPNQQAWSNDLFKGVFRKKGQVLGVLYFDLFGRSGKNLTSPCKLNIVCPKYSDNPQIPISVLSCYFQKQEENIMQNGISFQMLTVFYHQFGHAVHSLVGKSQYQAFSGTRVPVDLAELPSHIFEQFLNDYQFISEWAYHKQTGKKYPKQLFQFFYQSKLHFKGLNQHISLSTAIFDLQLHISGDVQSASTLLWQTLQCKQLTENWYLSFSHLGEYGSNMYVYPLNSALSEMVWKLVFRQQLNKEGGILLYQSLLQPGGNQDGKNMLHKLLAPSLFPTQTPTELDPFQVMLDYFQFHFKSTELINLDEHRKSLS